MYRFLTVLLLLSLLTGCTGLPALLSTPEPAPAIAETPSPTATSAPTTTPTSAPTGPRILRVWVPPQFDPSAETPAGALLQARLDEFVARRPGLQIEVRVKAESMLKALITTQAAAPSIMPDVVALSRTDLEAVSTTGLLHPLDGLSTLPDDPDWYPYARQMAHIKNTAFGLPFAGNALVLAGYGNTLPTSWRELPQETLFVFPAADPQATFSLSLYLSTGGALANEQGLPHIDEALLAEVLSLYEPPEENRFISPLVTEYTTDEQAWTALINQRGNLTVGWVSTYLQTKPGNVTIAPLPGLDSGQFTLATGWSWALAGSNLDNQPLAVELAEFLSDSVFLAGWNQATGHLSTRPTALSSWEDAQVRLKLAKSAESAIIIPDTASINVISPLLTEAVLAVVRGEKLPAEAAQILAEQVK